MPRRPPATAAVSFRTAGPLALAVASLFAACDGPGNTGVFAPDPNLVRDVPWFNGVLPALDAGGAAVVPDTPQYPPIGLGLPDPGSQHIDCSTVGNYTFSAGWFDSFEPLAAGEVGIAPGWASYDDLSKYSFHAPGDATWYPGLNPIGGTKLFSAAWGLPSENTPGPSCDGKPNDWVLHFRGGLFRRWGGGISHAFTDPDGWYRTKERDTACRPQDDFCPPPLAAGATEDTAGVPTQARNGDAYQQSHDFFDVTLAGYEGVAFWARRGPEGFDRVAVILTDKFTSGRLARGNEKFCGRVRECHTRCLSGAPCSPDDPTAAKPIYRCFDPAQGPLPTIAIESQMDQMYPRCGQSACTSPTTYTDPDFEGEQCRPYAYPASEESGEYCWNPGDPPPPDRDTRCQDGWLASVELTPNWKFHAIPFSKFSQAGFGKRAPYMDLKSLDTLAFGAPMGWADFFVDNVTLYHRKN